MDIPRNEIIRTSYFTDPIVGTLKKIIVVNNDKIHVYDENTQVRINLDTNEIIAITDEYIDKKLTNIQSKLKLLHGQFIEEIPEQRMVVRLFDTLVLDCEGAFYFILMDMPEILNNINLIIMENDYHEEAHKNYIDNVLLENGFIRHYYESGGWGPCYDNFFEVWKRGTGIN